PEPAGATCGRVWAAEVAASRPVAGPARWGVARPQPPPAASGAARASPAPATRWRPAPASSARTRDTGPSGGRTNGGGCDMALLPDATLGSAEPSQLRRPPAH